MKRIWPTLTMFSVALTVASIPFAVAQAPPPSPSPATITGTWQGTFSSRNYSPVPITLIINQGVDGKLAGALTLISPCLRDADLQLTINGSSLVLAGMDQEGDTITFKGSVDASGTQLTMTFILNGSASGRCETDDGSGTLTKKGGNTPQR